MKKHLLLMLGIIPSIAFGQTIGAYISPTEFREFMSHNLGADTSLDPLTPSQGIQGAKYQWGMKDPILTQAQDQDPANSGSISGWNTSPAGNNSWMDGTKAGNDPCPAGFRVPTATEWQGVASYNSITYTGTWVMNDPSNFNNGVFFGNSLYLPAAGSRDSVSGFILSRNNGHYQASTSGIAGFNRLFSFNNNYASSSALIGGLSGLSIRCISESPTLSTQDINKNKDLGLSLSPNPAKTEFSITHIGSSKKDLGKIKIEIYDLSGKLLLKQDAKEKISVNTLTNGVYLVKIITAEGKIQAEKLIVEK